MKIFKGLYRLPGFKKQKTFLKIKVSFPWQLQPRHPLYPDEISGCPLLSGLGTGAWNTDDWFKFHAPATKEVKFECTNRYKT
ncbi:hypothetical protein D3C87_876750 [compost metagenome]